MFELIACGRRPPACADRSRRQDDPDRLGDIGRRQYGGRDLVQERLEQVIIVAVEYGDIDG